MSITINPATSVENWPPTGIIVFLGGRKVNHGATIGTTLNGCVETAIENMQTLMSIAAGSSRKGSRCTGKRSLTGGTGCR